MVRHSLRTLQDRDHPGALGMLGFTLKPRLELANLSVTPSVALGASLVVDFDLISKAKQKLVIVLKVHFLKANGTLKPKVFRIGQWDAAKAQTTHFSKSQAFKPITTRVLYPGEHRVEIIVNGRQLSNVPFMFEG